MNPDNPTQMIEHEAHNPLHAMQSGEMTVCEIKRHPIGIIVTYLILGFVLLLTAVCIFTILPSVITLSSTKTFNYYGSLTILIMAFLGVCFALVSHIVYWGNRWVVTSDSITQIQQTGLFSKQASQLSLENLEDVTVEKNGILTQLFNFGTLKAETAGERSKFLFLYCPDPNAYARKILNARELFMQDVRAKESGRLGQVDPQQTPPSPALHEPNDGYTIP